MFQISLKNSGLKTTHNTFRGLSRALYPKTFLEIAVYVKKNYSEFERNFQSMYVFISIGKNNFNLASSLGVALEKDLDAVENFFKPKS